MLYYLQNIYSSWVKYLTKPLTRNNVFFPQQVTRSQQIDELLDVLIESGGKATIQFENFCFIYVFIYSPLRLYNNIFEFANSYDYYFKKMFKYINVLFCFRNASECQR